MDEAIQSRTLPRAANPAKRAAKTLGKGKASGKVNLTPYLFFAPAALVFLAFSYYPFLKTIVLSLTITDSSGTPKKFIGLKNYITMFASADFRDTLLTTFKFVPMIFFPTLLIGLCLALLAERKRRGSALLEVLFSLPMAVASASAAIIWRYVFNPTTGALNYLLGLDINWLTDKSWALFSVGIVTVWLQAGITFIFLLTGLRGIPPQLLESAAIDGCNPLQTFRHVKLVMLSPTLFFVVFFNITTSFQAFGQIRLLTQGGPGTSTNVLVYQIYKEAFMNNRYGSASAMAIVLFFIMLAVTLVQFRFENKGVHYS